MSTKRILLTGSNGLLGQKLVELLVRQPEIHTIATARGDNRLPFLEGYQYHAMDITNPEQIREVVALTQPDVIIHTAAMTNVDQCEFEKEACWNQNVKAVEYLVDACREQDIFLVHLSTDFIFDGADGPYDEDCGSQSAQFLRMEQVRRRKSRDQFGANRYPDSLGHSPHRAGVRHCATT